MPPVSPTTVSVLPSPDCVSVGAEEETENVLCTSPPNIVDVHEMSTLPSATKDMTPSEVTVATLVLELVYSLQPQVIE